MTAYEPEPAGEDTPPDPLGLDATRPHDIDACSPCDGLGAVVVWIEGEQTDDTCPRCYGTGIHH